MRHLKQTVCISDRISLSLYDKLTKFKTHFLLDVYGYILTTETLLYSLGKYNYKVLLVVMTEVY